MLKKRSAMRLLGVFAMVVGMLVPAATASAGGWNGDTDVCDGIMFNPLNPAHHMMGQTGAGWTIMDGYMFIDLSGATGPQVVFWNGEYAFGTGDGKGVYVIGSDYNDTICGTRSDDVIYGKKGNDRIFLSDGDNDYQDSTDWNPLSTEDCAEWCGDRAFGGAGHDLIFNGWVDDDSGDSGYGAFMSGGKGNDMLFAGDGDVMKGGQGNDELYAYYPWNSDVQSGDSGDTLYMYGGQGNDILVGDDSNNSYAYFYGRSGDDTIYPGGRADGGYNWDKNDAPEYRLTPGGWTNPGANRFDAVWVFGGAGNDTIDGRYLDMQGATSSVSDYQLWYGGDGDDHFWFGGDSNDVAAFGGQGSDMFHDLGSDDDQFAFGGSGNDTFFPEDDDPVAAGVQTGYDFFASGEAGDDTINGGEQNDVLLGGTGTDTIKGDAGYDDIKGGDGDDVLEGGAGNDVIEGDAGDDVIKGGADADDLFGGTDWDNDDNATGTDAGDCAATPKPLPEDKPCVDDGDDTIWGGTGGDDIDGGSGDNVMYGNMPDPTFGLDVSDNANDDLQAWNTLGTTTFTNYFYGHCGADLDDAVVQGAGTLDWGYSVVSSTIDNQVSPC